MKTKILKLILLLITIVICLLCKAQNLYLGQKPPGNEPELFAPGIVSTGSHEMDIAISPNGDEILFTRSGPDWHAAIIHIKLEKNKWSEPKIAEFSGKFPNNFPFFSPQGDKIFYDSREELPGLSDKEINRNIFISKKTKNGWSNGVPIGFEINTPQHEMDVTVAKNGNLYFCADYDNSKGGFDIYLVKKEQEGYAKPVNLGESINTKSGEFHPFIDPNEKYILFDSFRNGGFGMSDIYISIKKEDGSWTEAQNIGNIVNDERSDFRPFVSPDQKYLFFCSNRLNPQIESKDKALNIDEHSQRIEGPGNGNQDIYWVDINVISEFFK
jgi:Tol biopolymer transport system component